jgi:ABC-2 type transport system permease protein
MIRIVVALTLRQLIGRGRTLLMGLLALLPILLAVVYRLGSEDVDRQRWVAQVLFEGLVVTTLLPLVALVYGTAALGAEIEDGTAVYLLTKPVSRARIMLAKLVAAWALTSVTVLASGLVAGAIALAGVPGHGLLPGFAIALVAGGLVYSALFLMLSVRTSRALIAGLVYVFVWEGLVNGLFAGTRLLSVRHATLAVADLLVDLPASVFEAKLGPVAGVVLLALLCTAATWYGIRRLQRFEIGESI